MQTLYRYPLALLFGLTLLLGCEPSEPAFDQAEIIVYSARKEHLIKPVFDLFTEQTGIPIRYITDEAGPLLARLQAEGQNTPADILMTVDAGNLWQAAQAGLLQATPSSILSDNIPNYLRDPDNLWFALTVRARTIVYHTDRVHPEALSSYEDLADMQWRGHLCLRTAKKVYNQSLVATMIASLGMATTEQIVTGWVNNLALAPLANDTLVMEAIIANQCDVGIINSYYFGRLKHSQPDVPLALFWPNQQGSGSQARGVHVNISGAGMTRYAKHPKQAKQLLEWLSGVTAQQQLMTLNLEYPVNPTVPPSDELQSFGSFRADAIHVSEAGRLQVEAIKLMDRVRYR